MGKYFNRVIVAKNRVQLKTRLIWRKMRPQQFDRCKPILTRAYLAKGTNHMRLKKQAKIREHTYNCKTFMRLCFIFDSRGVCTRKRVCATRLSSMQRHAHTSLFFRSLSASNVTRHTDFFFSVFPLSSLVQGWPQFLFRRCRDEV